MCAGEYASAVSAMTSHLQWKNMQSYFPYPMSLFTNSCPGRVEAMPSPSNGMLVILLVVYPFDSAFYDT